MAASLSLRARSVGLRAFHVPGAPSGLAVRLFVTTQDGGALKIDGLPLKRGLYDPLMEKDSCGTGFVCQIDGACGLGRRVAARAAAPRRILAHRIQAAHWGPPTTMWDTSCAVGMMGLLDCR
jgi:hypothetical protein